MPNPMGTSWYRAPALYRYLARAHEVALVLYDCMVAPLQELLPSLLTRRSRLPLTMEIITA